MENPKVHSKGMKSTIRNGGERIAQPAKLNRETVPGSLPARDMSKTGNVVTRQVGVATDGSGRQLGVGPYSQATRRPEPASMVVSPTSPLTENTDSIRQMK